MIDACAASDEVAGRARERHPTHRRRNDALNAPCLSATADRAARAKIGPQRPAHPNPAPKAGKGALRRAHPGSPGPFLFDRGIRRSRSRRRRERSGPLVWKEASCSGICSWGFAVRAGRRTAGACEPHARSACPLLLIPFPPIRSRRRERDVGELLVNPRAACVLQRLVLYFRSRSRSTAGVCDGYDGTRGNDGERKSCAEAVRGLRS